MGFRNWSKVSLGGMKHRIPGICPNCLAPAQVELRYPYKDRVGRFFYPFGGNYQTFLYCSPCSEGARAGIRHNRVVSAVSWFLSLMILTFVAALLLGLLIGKWSPLHPYWMILMKATNQWILLILPASGILLAYGITALSRRRGMRKHPKQDGQAVWGIAAYFTDGWNNYIAARPEWIRALVELNSDCVSDNTYMKWTGRAKPVP
jgi:hypothetical protein